MIFTSNLRIFFFCKPLMCCHVNPNPKVQISDTFWKKVFEKQTLSSDFRQCLKSKLFGNRAVIECLKSILVWISDARCTFVPNSLKTFIGLRWFFRSHLLLFTFSEFEIRPRPDFECPKVWISDLDLFWKIIGIAGVYLTAFDL